MKKPEKEEEKQSVKAPNIVSHGCGCSSSVGGLETDY